MRGTIQAVALCLILSITAGCLSYEQRTTLAADGSGTVVVDTWLDYYGTGEEDEETASETPPPEVSEELGPAFAGLAGVEIEENWTKIEGEGDDRREHTHLVLAFDKVERLNGLGIFSNQELTFKKASGEFVFTQVVRNERENEEEETTAASEELARAIFEDYTFTYTVALPGRVTETNGTPGEDGRSVTWEWPLYDFLNQEEISMTAVASEDRRSGE